MLRIIGHVAPAGTACLERLIADGVCGSAIYAETLSSTNSLAMEQLSRGEIDPAGLPRLYLADSQTAGRGRQGRSWLSSEDSLTFSLLMDTTSVAGGADLPLSIRVGVLTADALDAFIAPHTTELKWPNDLYLQGHKVGGILIEASQKTPRLAVVGIGINVRWSPENEQLESPVAATSIASFASQPLDRLDVLDEVVRRLASSDRNHTAAASTIASFRHRCWLTGRQISLHQSGRQIEGLCRGIDDAGQLLVETDGRLLAIHSGEASLVRRQSL